MPPPIKLGWTGLNSQALIQQTFSNRVSICLLVVQEVTTYHCCFTNKNIDKTSLPHHLKQTNKQPKSKVISMSFLYSFGTTFHTHSTSNEGEDFPFFSDPSFFNNSHTDISHENSNPFDEPFPSSSSLDPFSPSFFSPPRENLNLYQAFDESEVKIEESQMGNVQFLPHSYSGVENVSKYMQRSFSSNSFESKPGFLFRPQHHILMDSPHFQRNDISSPEISFFTGQMRKVCSTGDLQVKN